MALVAPRKLNLLILILLLPPPHCTCRYVASLHERRLRAIVSGLMQEGMLPAGSIVDAGANDGEEACRYAAEQPSRLVHALDPLAANVNATLRRCGGLANLRAAVGGLGSAPAVVAVPERLRRMTRGGRQAQVDVSHIEQGGSAVGDDGGGATQSFRVWRIDDLFFGGTWAAERLAFAHWDVEGNEAAVVAGATRTLARDRPLLTLEVVLFPAAQAREQRFGWEVDAAGLLRTLHQQLDYATFVVEESCGVGAQCRNLLCVPRAQLATRLAASTTLRTAIRLGHLTRVDATNLTAWVAAHPYKYPGGSPWAGGYTRSTQR